VTPVEAEADAASAESILRAARALSVVSADPDRVAGSVAAILQEEVGLEGAAVTVLEGAVFRVEGATGTLAGVVGERFNAEGSLSLLAVEQRRTLVSTPSAPIAVAPQLADRFSTREVAAAPMMVGGEAVGSLVALNPLAGAFSERQLATLTRLAELASLAVHNARLLDRERRSVRDAASLADFVHQLNQSLEFERVVALVADKARNLLHGEGSALSIVDSGSLTLVAASGAAAPQLGMRASHESSLGAAAVRDRRSLRGARHSAAEPLPPFECALFPHSRRALATPLMVADRPIGAIVVAGAGEFTHQDDDLLRALASHGAIAIENSRLYRAAAHTARHAETLSMAAQSLSRPVAPSGFFESLYRVAADLLAVDGLTVYAVDPERQSTRVVYAGGIAAPDGFSVGENVANDAMTALLLAGTEGFYPRMRATPESGRAVALARLPLVAEGRLRGALTLRWKHERTFGEDDRILLRDFSTQVAIALRNTDLIADLERRAQRFSAIARMQQVISHMELHDVYVEVKRSARTAVPQAQVVALLALSADRRMFLPRVITVDSVVTWSEALASVPVGRCAASRAVETGDRVASRQPVRAWSALVAGHEDRVMRSEIAIALSHGDKAAGGVLIVQSDDPHAFSAEDSEVLAIIARQAGTAIENARLFEAERRTREVAEAAAEISRAALASAGTDQTARHMLGLIDRVAPSHGKALALVDTTGTLLRYVSASGVLASLQHLVVPQDRSAATIIGSGPSPIVADGEMLALIREGEIVPPGGQLIPLIAKSRILGILWTVPDPDEEDDGRVQQLAASLALAADVLLLDEEERQRREREQMLATALATMQQPVLITGLDRRVLYANAAAVDEYGFGVEEFGGLPLDRLIDSWVPARRVTPDGPTLVTGTWAAEHIHRRKDGTKFPASVLLSSIRDESGAPVGQVVAVRNVTEEHRLQEQLRQTEKLAALGELVAGVAHELNNPLAGISAFAQLMMDDELNEEHHESVRLIKREADRAVGVIRDLLIFSRKSGPSRSLIDVNEIVERTLRLRGYSLRSAGIEVQVDLGQVPLVPGDDQRIQQVLLNLIVNAENALQRAEIKRLVVRTEVTREGLALVVRDTGVGMTEEIRQRIFEPFFTTKEAGEGTGLGLSVSYGIVRAHGGTIAVESAPLRGTTFRVDLPNRFGNVVPA
jgi:PAS domain S-box-containing protein